MAGVVRVKIEDEEYDSVTKGTDLLTSPPASSRPSRKRRAPELYEPSTAVKIELKTEERIPPNAALLSKASSTKTGKKGSQSSKKSRKKIAGDEPYPDYALPLSHHCLVARDSLAHLHNYLPGANPAEDTGKSSSTDMCHLAAGSSEASRSSRPLRRNVPNTHLEAATVCVKEEEGDENAVTIPAPTSGAVKAHKDRSQSVLDSLVRTILSQNTTDRTSARAFASLKEKLPTWEAVLAAPNEIVEDAIREGGLAEIKTARVKTILQTVKDEQTVPAPLSLEHLRELPTDQVKRYLTSFKGVGPKTVSCVLMFTLGRAEFPVDTHVWHIAKKLRWVPPNATRETTYEHLNRRIPDELKYDLHVLLVEHGKRCRKCCKDGRLQKESHGECPLCVASLPSGR